MPLAQTVLLPPSQPVTAQQTILECVFTRQRFCLSLRTWSKCAVWTDLSLLSSSPRTSSNRLRQASGSSHSQKEGVCDLIVTPPTLAGARSERYTCCCSRRAFRHFAELGVEHALVPQVFRRLRQDGYSCTGVLGWPRHHSKPHPQDSSQAWECLCPCLQEAELETPFRPYSINCAVHRRAVICPLTGEATRPYRSLAQ